MANIVPFAQAGLPAHLKGRASTIDHFTAGLSTFVSFPTIGCNGTRFEVTVDGEKETLKTLELAAILLDAKESMDRQFYKDAFDPNSGEFQAPTCSSRDNIRPDPTSPEVQSELCQNCPQNVYGTATDAKGNPGKGKACREIKWLAIFANSGVYGLKVNPGSFKNFKAYTDEAKRHGILDLSTCITVIGFDDNFSYPVYSFGFGGFLSEAQQVKIDSLAGTDQIVNIVGDRNELAPTPVTKEELKAVESKQEPALDPFGEETTTKTSAPEHVKEVKKGRGPAKDKVVDLKPETKADPADDGGVDLQSLADSLGIDL
jgi:hypothetical protein